MPRLALRSLVMLAAVSALAACGTDPVSTPAVTPSLDREASAPFATDVEALVLVPGQTHAVGVTKDANGQPVPASSIRWATSDAAVAAVDAEGVVTAGAPGTATVTVSRGSHAIAIAVTVEPCTTLPLPLGTTTGEITTGDCFFALGNRYGDYYTITPANGEVVELQTVGLAGVNGFKVANLDPRVGAVFGAMPNNRTYRMIGNGDAVQFYLGGSNVATLGAYTVTRGVAPTPYQCGTTTFVMLGATFGATLDEATACARTVLFTSFPEALGKPIRTHMYALRLDAGRPYTVTVDGVGATFNPALTIFPNSATAPPVAQSVEELAEGATSRALTFTPAVAGYYFVELSAGRFVDGTWTVQTGDYTLHVTR